VYRNPARISTKNAIGRHYHYGPRPHPYLIWMQSLTGTLSRRLSLSLVATAAVLLAALRLLAFGSGAQAADLCAAPPNPIVRENCKPGSPASEWSLGAVDTSTIEGFATDISANRGETVRFKVNTTATAYRIDVYRMGYYAGFGARKVATVPNTATLKQRQPACLVGPSDANGAATGLIDCGNWAESASWAVPADAVSGIHFARLVREDGTAGANFVFFVVRDDQSTASLLFQTADTTWQAYNDYGGNSLYANAAANLPARRAYKVSYNRPFSVRTADAEKHLPFNAEYPMVRWLEANGYDTSYLSGLDVERKGAAYLQRHRAFLSVGHDEYWSGGQRANVEAARAAGVHLAFFSGNEVYWKVRWEPSVDGSATPQRTLVTYKETLAGAKIDPDPAWTGTWRDPRMSPPADGGRPENALTGSLFTVAESSFAIQVPAADGKLRLWRNTDIATLPAGQTATLAGQTLGFEWNEDLDNGARPPGLMRLSSTTVSVPAKLIDYGSTVAPGTATHSLTLYRHASGALVFGAGTIQWSWGLDGNHDRSPSTPDARMQQATVNLLADMGAQPTTLQAGLVAASASTDTTAPTSTIASPAAGATLPTGTAVTISGTAADAGGGVVGAVEVSVDGGATWHPATGRESWTYSWTPTTTGPATIRVRAADDSGNLESPGQSRALTIVLPPCPCTLWSDATAPAQASAGSSEPIELGVKFRAEVDGYVTGVRFYKGPGNTGTHLGHLWTGAGAPLATATFAGETSSGWQQVSFASPIPVVAGTTYVASYFAPNGGYAYDPAYFATAAVHRAPLRAPESAAVGGNGVFRTGGGFPTSTYNSANYWVDVVFAITPPPDTRPPTIAAVQASGITRAGATIGWTTDEPADGQVEYGTTTAYGSASPLDAAQVGSHSTSLSGLAAGTLYHYRVKSRDAAGNLATSADFTFTTATPASCPCTIWSDATTPPTSTFEAGGPIELGVKVRASVDGYVTGLRFYRLAGDPGPHVGHLWSSTGTLLATATFAGGSTAGWQQVSLAAPVAVSANTTYVASYLSSTGRYVAASGYFATAGVQRDPLQALAGGVDGPNGVFRSGGGFPTEAFNATYYGADVVFATSIPTQTCPCSLWNEATAPAVGSFQHSEPLELGLRFSSTTDGYVTGMRFHKAAGDTGTHVGHLWSSTGTLLASATFTNESASGWQQVKLATPVAIDAGKTYVVSYLTSAGRYVASVGYFGSAGVQNGQLRALASGPDGPNGVFRLGGGFPSEGYNATYYGADVVFDTSLGFDGTASTIDAAQASAISPVSATVTWTTDEPADSQVEYGLTTSYGSATSLDPASRTSHSQTLSGLSPGTLYHYRIRSRDAAGNLATSPDLTFTTQSCPCTIWGDATVPLQPSTADISAIEVGVRFRSSVDGYASGIRFYKGPGNTGTHVAHLWTNSGAKLAEETFSAESGAGWQQVTFATPVAISANTTYVASYYAPAGHYAADPAYFASASTAGGPLSALASGSDGPNGLYRYGASGFPTSSYNSTNYWVDVVFTTAAPSDTAAPAVQARSPAAGATDVALGAAVTATFSEPVQPATIVWSLRGAGGAAVAGTASYDAATRTARFTPTSALALGTTYSVELAGAADLAGHVLATQSWSFSTPACPCSVWSESATPAVTNLVGGGPLELGMRFRVAADGRVTGLRFYKGPNNSGTHVGNLWSASGQLLASVTFGGESATGWQTASFLAPVPVAAGTTYVISYSVPDGGYAYDSAYFADQSRASGPLVALGGADGPNGVYAFGTGVFPASSYNATNYWVDPIFTTGP
jgi:hypothetical protein